MPLRDVLDRLPHALKAHEHVRFHWYPHTQYAVLTTLNRTKLVTTSTAWPALLARSLAYWLSRIRSFP